MELTVFTPPTIEPLLLADVIDHSRLTDLDEEADLVSTYITSARRHIEETYGVAFCPQVLEYALDAFPCSSADNRWGAIVLPRPPLQSVTSITYVDQSGVSQTLSTSVYEVDTRPYLGEVRPKYNQSWPSTRDQKNAVIVRYNAGYVDADSIPENMKMAVRFLTGDLYYNREDIQTAAMNRLGMITRLMAPYRAWVTP